MKIETECAWCGKTFEIKSSQVKNHNYCSRACLGKANAERFRLARIKICANCGKEFEYKGHHTSRNKHFFCCTECVYEFKNVQMLVNCDWCGKPFYKKRSAVARTKHNFCDHNCYRDFINFEQAGATNQIVDGKCLYRKLAEIKIGRPLQSNEEVHHIDGNHENNNPDNLKVLTASEHSKLHAAMKRRDSHGRFTKQR